MVDVKAAIFVFGAKPDIVEGQALLSQYQDNDDELQRSGWLVHHVVVAHTGTRSGTSIMKN